MSLFGKLLLLVGKSHRAPEKTGTRAKLKAVDSELGVALKAVQSGQCTLEDLCWEEELGEPRGHQGNH